MIQINNHFVSSSDGKLICRASRPTLAFHRSTLLPGETAADFLELDAPPQLPPYTKAEYSAEVERLIARRYTSGQEIQLLAERESDPEAYAAYRTYVDQCKLDAQANLTAPEEEPDETETD